jgi:hypothetical protein
LCSLVHAAVGRNKINLRGLQAVQLVLDHGTNTFVVSNELVSKRTLQFNMKILVRVSALLSLGCAHWLCYLQIGFFQVATTITSVIEAQWCSPALSGHLHDRLTWFTCFRPTYFRRFLTGFTWANFDFIPCVPFGCCCAELSRLCLAGGKAWNA